MCVGKSVMLHNRDLIDVRVETSISVVYWLASYLLNTVEHRCSNAPELEQFSVWTKISSKFWLGIRTNCGAWTANANLPCSFWWWRQRGVCWGMSHCPNAPSNHPYISHAHQFFTESCSIRSTFVCANISSEHFSVRTAFWNRLSSNTEVPLHI